MNKNICIDRYKAKDMESEDDMMTQRGNLKKIASLF